MATPKKFLDQIGVSYLWSKILHELTKKADKSNVDSLEDRVEVIETTEITTIYGGSASDMINGEENG